MQANMQKTNKFQTEENTFHTVLFSGYLKRIHANLLRKSELHY